MKNKVYLLFDFTHMFYKYKYALEAGKMKSLSHNGEDISKMYYCLRDIEKTREKYEKLGYEVSVHVALDSKSDRKKENDTYKNTEARNEKRLNEDEFSQIGETARLLRKAGYEVLKIEGLEADDIVSSWSASDIVGLRVIYTNDADLLINVKHDVEVELYNSFKCRSSRVDMNNFVEFTRNKFKSEMFNYNHIMLWKSTVGDKSDGIVGIKGFGPKTYDKLIVGLQSYIKGNDALFVLDGYTQKVIECACRVGLIGVEQREQALESLNMVKPRYTDLAMLTTDMKNSTLTSRQEAYSEYEFVSLYKI